MGVAADCTYTQRYGNQTQARQQILTDWNSASSVYKSTFNISLGILELQVFNGTCPTTADPATPWNVGCGSLTLNDRLSLFSQWRGSKGNDGTGLWHLLSQCTTGSEVGIAWLATLFVLFIVLSLFGG
jgi:Metallo-peptidase family M12